MRRRLDHGDIFRRVVVNSLRQFCTMYKINDEPVIAIDGRLMVTVHSGDIYELNVHEVNVESIGSSVRKKRKTRNTTAVAVSSKVLHDENSQAASYFDKVSQAADNIVDTGFGNDCHVESASAIVGSSFSCSLDLIPVTDVETLADVNVYTSEVQVPVFDSSDGASCSVNTEELSAPALQPTADCFAVEDQKPDVDLLLNCEVETTVSAGSKASVLSELSKACGKRSGGHISETKIIKLHNTYSSRRAKLASLRGTSRAVAKEERSSDRHYSRRRLQRTVGSTGTMFNCIECPDASYTSFELYHKHYLRHHGPISCHVCQLRILGHQNLRDHVQEEHPGETAYKATNRFVCEYCSYVATQLSTLEDHINSHHFGVNYQCSICKKVLRTAITLKKHIRQQHDPSYVRVCSVCERKFRRTNQLNEHIRRIHPEMMTEEQRLYSASLVCTVCDVGFSRLEALRRHNELKHESGSVHSCPECGAGFPARRYLLRHFRTRHPVSNCAITRLKCGPVSKS